MASGVAGPRCCVFKAGRNLSLRCVPHLPANLARIYRFPVGSGPGPEARRKKTRLPIVATSSGRLFLNGLLASIARLRFTGTRNVTCNFTSPGKRGHFYFASEGTFLLCLDNSHSAVDPAMDSI
jgi:hypothetical protein